jgi:DNA-binding LytR/AlgR family response regulator
MDTGKTRCLIIDDEPPAIKLIKNHLQKFSSFEITGECKNAFQAVDILKKRKIDLMFLDIQLPEISGLDFLRSIPKPPYTILTSAYREYAIEGYDLDVVDFLMKPISFERFMKAINRYNERTRKTSTEKIGYPGETPIRKSLFINNGKNSVKVIIDDILYLEASGEYVKFVTADKSWLVRETLLNLESRISPGILVRIHKSYIVNIRKITRFSTIHVIVNDTQLPIGRVYRDKVRSILKNP